MDNTIQAHQKELCNKLWAMANALRGNMAVSYTHLCYLHGFSRQFQSALYARKPAWNLDFLKKSPENTEKSPIGSNQRFFCFWKELRKERKEQKSIGNTRTVRMPTTLIKILRCVVMKENAINWDAVPDVITKDQLYRICLLYTSIPYPAGCRCASRSSSLNKRVLVVCFR